MIEFQRIYHHLFNWRYNFFFAYCHQILFILDFFAKLAMYYTCFSRQRFFTLSFDMQILFCNLRTFIFYQQISNYLLYFNQIQKKTIIVQLKQQMSIQKPKQTFLKKGARQFLSNATVRSLSQKPKIIEYTQQEQPKELISHKAINHNSQGNNAKNNHKSQAAPVKSIESIFPTSNQTIQSVQKKKMNQEQEIVIPVKNKKNRSNSKHNTYQNQNTNIIEQNNIRKQTRVVRQKPQINKRPAVLQDYLCDNQTQKYENIGQKKVKNNRVSSKEKRNSQNKNNLNQYLQQQEQQIRSIEQKKIIKEQKKSNPNSMAVMLQQQQHPEIDQSGSLYKDIQENQFIESDFKNKKNVTPKQNVREKLIHRQIRIADQKPTVLNFRQQHKVEQNKQLIKEQLISQRQQKSDRNDALSFNQFLKDRQQQQKANSFQPQNVGTSKVAQKYFGIKGNESSKISGANLHLNSITIDMVPKQLKTQIIKTHLKQMQEKIEKQLKQIQNEKYNAKRGNEKNEQERRKLQKQRQQFEKEMQLRQNQFQQRIKSENSKLNREKKYMKGYQEASKGDWKLKSEVQEAKKLLEDLTADKKRNEVKMKGDIERLKKRLDQQINRNKLLNDQIKLLEHGELENKKQIKQLKMRIQNKSKAQKIKSNPWSNFPKASITDRFLEEGFHLYQFRIDDYHYQNIDEYAFYRSLKAGVDELESQKVQDGKITRIYKNSKVETQVQNRFLKQDFTSVSYSVISFIQGDVKQKLPNGMTVYFDARTNAVEYLSADKSKKIFYFVDKSQVDLHWKKKDGDYCQVYSGNKWKCIWPNGFEEEKILTQKGFV